MALRAIFEASFQRRFAYPTPVQRNSRSRTKTGRGMPRQTEWVRLNLVITAALESMRWRVKDLTNEELGYLADEMTDLLVNRISVSDPGPSPDPSSVDR